MGWVALALLGWLASIPPPSLPSSRGPGLSALAATATRATVAEAAASLRAGEPVHWPSLRRVLVGQLTTLAEAGYFDAEVLIRSEETDSLRVTLEIDRGARWTWGDIELKGRPVVPLPEVGERLARLRGSHCTLSHFESAMREVLDVYDRGGYPFAQVAVDSLVERDGVVNAVLTVTEGPQVTWGRLHLVGAKKTTATTAGRIVGFTSGARFDSRVLDGARPRLRTSGLFSWVGEPVLRGGATSDIVDLELQVTEARASSAVGALGYVPAREGADGYFVGRAELLLENIAGTGRSAQLSWERAAPGASSMSVGYREPWLLGTPFSIRLRLMQDIYDTTYTKRRGELEVGMLVANRMEAAVGIAGERIQAAEDSEAAFPTYVKYEGSVHAKWEGRDRPILPERGWFADVLVSYGHRRSQADSLDESTPEAVADCSGELYLPFGRWAVLALAGGAKVLVSDAERLPPPLQFPLGGAGDLRGYREEQFRGAQVVWLNVDPRVLRWSRGAVGPFVDVGYYHLSSSRGGSGGHIKLGYGVGVRSVTRLGLLSLDYGIGEDTDPLDGRIHLSLKARF